MEEYLSLFVKNENGEPVSIPDRMLREEAPAPKGIYALGVAVFVADSHGRLLMTLRSPEKKAWPNYWENSGGAARYGENARQAIRRELREETGIAAEEEEFIPLKTFWLEDVNEIMDVFLLHKDWPLEKIVLQPQETSDARWCSHDEYEEVIAHGRMAGPIVLRYNDLKKQIWQYADGWNVDK